MTTTGWIAFLLAALKALPALISLISSIKGSADAASNQGIGYDRAVKESLELAAVRIQMADEAAQEAERDHATKDDDSAFDQDFKRP